MDHALSFSLMFLCGPKVFASNRSLAFANSRSLRPLSLVSVLQCSPQVPSQSFDASFPIFAFQSPCTIRMSFFFFWRFIQDFLQLIVECFDFVIVIACCWGIHLYDDDVGRACPESKRDESTRNWTATQDRTHDGFVDQEANSVFVFVLLPAVIYFMPFLCCGFSEIFPSYLTDTNDVPVVHCHLIS